MKDIGRYVISVYWRSYNMDVLPCYCTCLSGIRVVHMIKLHVFTLLVPCCNVLRYPRKNDVLCSHLLCREFMLYKLYLFTHTDVQYDFCITWCSCRLAVTRLVTVVEQALLTLPEHMSSSPDFVCFTSINAKLHQGYCFPFMNNSGFRCLCW